MATGQLALWGIPVLLYHGLSTSPEVKVDPRDRKYWLFEAQFRQQLDQIRSGGYRVVRLEDLRNGTAMWEEKPPVVLTFDDGLVSDYEVAYPLLLEAGVSAAFFVNTATIGEPGFLSWRQITEMQRAGMSFQSHSHEHVDLTRLSPRTLERQVGDSKLRLEDRLGHPIQFLAVPYGRWNSRVVEVARRVGYRAVCISRSWLARPGARLINRVAVYRHTPPGQFSRLLARHPIPYVARAGRAALVSWPRRLLLRFRPARLGVGIREGHA